MGAEQDLDSMHSMIFHSLAGACWLAVDGWRRVTSELQPQHWACISPSHPHPHHCLAPAIVQNLFGWIIYKFTRHFTLNRLFICLLHHNYIEYMKLPY